MRPDDAFRIELEATVRAAEAWCQRHRDVAAIALEPAPAYWRLGARPHAPSACPVEVVLHADQSWDLAIGPEIYEGLTDQPLSRLLPLLEAVSAGRVVTRSVRSATTGLPLSVHTLIAIGDGEAWQRVRVLGEAPAETRTVNQDRRYVPYRQR